MFSRPSQIPLRIPTRKRMRDIDDSIELKVQPLKKTRLTIQSYPKVGNLNKINISNYFNTLDKDQTSYTFFKITSDLYMVDFKAEDVMGIEIQKEYKKSKTRSKRGILKIYNLTKPQETFDKNVCNDMLSDGYLKSIIHSSKEQYYTNPYKKFVILNSKQVNRFKKYINNKNDTSNFITPYGIIIARVDKEYIHISTICSNMWLGITGMNPKDQWSSYFGPTYSLKQKFDALQTYLLELTRDISISRSNIFPDINHFIEFYNSTKTIKTIKANKKKGILGVKGKSTTFKTSLTNRIKQYIQLKPEHNDKLNEVIFTYFDSFNDFKYLVTNVDKRLNSDDILNNRIQEIKDKIKILKPQLNKDNTDENIHNKAILEFYIIQLADLGLDLQNRKDQLLYFPIHLPKDKSNFPKPPTLKHAINYAKKSPIDDNTSGLYYNISADDRSKKLTVTKEPIALLLTFALGMGLKGVTLDSVPQFMPYFYYASSNNFINQNRNFKPDYYGEDFTMLHPMVLSQNHTFKVYNINNITSKLTESSINEFDCSDLSSLKCKVKVENGSPMDIDTPFSTAGKKRKKPKKKAKKAKKAKKGGAKKKSKKSTKSKSLVSYLLDFINGIIF